MNWFDAYALLIWPVVVAAVVAGVAYAVVPKRSREEREEEYAASVTELLELHRQVRGDLARAQFLRRETGSGRTGKRHNRAIIKSITARLAHQE